MLFIYCCSDNSKLCSCGGDRQIFYWDVATGRVIRKFRGHDSEVEYFFVLPYTTSQLLQLCFIDFLGNGLKLIVVAFVIDISAEAFKLYFLWNLVRLIYAAKS